MADYKVLGTDHTAYTVSDIDRSVKMFCEVLGFELISDDRAEADMVESLNGIAAPLLRHCSGPHSHSRGQCAGGSGSGQARRHGSL